MAEKRKGRDADEKAEDGPAGQSGVGDFAVGGSDYFDDYYFRFLQFTKNSVG